MKKIILCLSVFLIAALPCWAVDLRIPSQVKGEPGDFIVIKAETTGKIVKWVVLDKELKMFPNELLKDSKVAIVIGSKIGKYKILAYTALADEPSDPAVCTVIVGEDPGPNPPDPPDPPPLPTDPLVKVLKEAFDKETATNKSSKIKELASLYKEASSTTVYNTDLKTTKDLRQVMSVAIDEMIGKDSLTTVRRAIANELNKIFPTDPSATLDKDKRDLISKQFERLGKALEVVK